MKRSTSKLDTWTKQSENYTTDEKSATLKILLQQLSFFITLDEVTNPLKLNMFQQLKLTTAGHAGSDKLNNSVIYVYTIVFTLSRLVLIYSHLVRQLANNVLLT